MPTTALFSIPANELMCLTSSNLSGMVNKWRDVLSKWCKDNMSPKPISWNLKGINHVFMIKLVKTCM